MRAIQVHPHDVRDEGAAAVVRNISQIGKIRVICPEVSSLEERHPYPSGSLPHNPVRKCLVTSATLETPLDFAGSLPFRPALSREAKMGEDYIGALSDAAEGANCCIVPWIKGLNGAFEGNAGEFCVSTASGEAVPAWLCPSKPATLAYVTELVDKTIARYGSKAVLLDRMRYPDWSGDGVRPERMFGCFCPDCCRLMSEDGIDVDALAASLAKLLPALGNEAALAMTEREKREICSWMAFRRDRITKLTASLRRAMLEAHPGVRLWLNLWPPSFAPFLGQDYPSLGRMCDGAKHFPYHKLGGGADLKGLTDSIGTDENARERVFRRLIKFLKLPYEMSAGEFAENGFPVRFVRDETASAKRAFGNTPVFGGIQIWDVAPEEIGPACDAALSGGASGFFFYCYGWASLESLSEVGRIKDG
jgi:hypothetical protein